MTSVRLLAMDLDGTILTNDKRITDRTMAALEAAIQQGIAVVPVTGRPYSGLPEPLLTLPGIRYVITSNGAVTIDRMKGEILRSSLIDPDVAEEIIRMPLQEGLIYNVFLDGYGYCDEATYERLYAMFRDTPLCQYVKNSRRSCPDIHARIRQHKGGVENIWIVGKDSRQRDEINARVLEHWDLHTVLTAKQDIEIGNPAADKGHAVRELADYLEIEIPQVLAIGDNENDLGMLQMAGISVAMGNATDFVKSSAAIVTDSNEEDGAAKVIEKILM